MNRHFLTVAIPTYEMRPHGPQFLSHSLSILDRQTFKDFNIVISDHSMDDSVENVVKSWSGKLDIKYLRKDYDRDNPSGNLNNAIMNSNGAYIKLLFQDDFLFDHLSLEKTAKAITENAGCEWLASACMHSNDGVNFDRAFFPTWNDRMLRGINTISCPSVITIENSGEKLLFDTALMWLMDCEYYQRAHSKFGPPVFLNEITVVNRIWQNQLTNTLSADRKKREFDVIRSKYRDCPDL